MFRLMEKARNRNNKGFSLVELIVVVLIIAIIAVALAPQVVKYVGTARENVTKNNAATIKSAVQAAVAEYQGTEGATLTACSFEIAANASVVKDTTSPETTASKALKDLIQKNVGTDSLDRDYTVEVTAPDATVTVQKKQ